jgi:FKBP12-rapamycin complex-associated protein
VVYAQLKYTWANGAKEESLNFLRQFSSSLSRDLQAEVGESSSHSGIPKHKLSELSKLLARCYFKTGEWQVELADDWGSASIFGSFFHFTISDLIHTL